MKRRILSILCVLALCLGLLPPVTASAAAPSTLTVGGTTITSSGYWTTNADGTLTAEMASADNYNVYYDGDGTLTLKDATINGTDTIYHVGAGIFASGDLTIVLEGSSTVKGVQDPNGETQSIRVEGNLTIQGGGSLTAQGAETSSGSSYGIFVFGSFTQQSGSVTASGGNINGNHTSTGLYVSDGTVTAQDGTLTATGGDTSGRSYGISANGSVTVSDATVTATGGTGNYSYGLYVNSSSSSPSPSVTLSGSGSLAARSGSGTDTAVGIYFENPFGSTRSVTVGNGSTLLTNSVIFMDSDFNENPLAPTGDGSWLIYGQSDQTSAVGGNYTLEENITIESGNTLTIPAGSTLTVPQGKTLTVNGTLTNQGTLSIAAESCLTGSGSLEGDGSFTAVAVTGIEVPDGVTCADYEKKVVLAGPTVLGHAFTADGWTLTFTKGEVTLDGCTYTVTASKEGSESIEKTFTAQHSFGEDGKCPCGASLPQTDAQGRYQLADAFQLFWFAGLVNGTLTDGTEQNTSASAVLTADIDLSGETWTPIGSESTPYIGTFDGQGYTISGMTIENAESYSGLFGNVTGTVKNFTVTGSITITGDETVAKVGGAVGSLGTASAGGTVSGVTSGVDITVSAGNDHIGGVVGSMPENSSPTVENCIYTGKITVTAAAGSVAGIVGYIRTGTIQNCANQGSISVDVGGTGSVGGILGYCNNGGIYIRNCYNTGAISADGTDNVGAIVGQNKGTQATVSNCYYLTGSANQGQGQLTTDAAGTVVKTADEFASGEVAWLLNGGTATPAEGETLAWYQNLDNGQTKDDYPVLDSTHGTVYCIDEDTYSNNPDATTEPTDISSATVTLNQSSFTYNGQSQKPTVTVTLGDKTLTEDTDYTVSFSGDTTNVGEVTVTIKGTGNYTGEATNKPSYTINKATPTLTWSEGSQTLPYTGSPADITAPTVNLVNNETYSGTISYKYKTKEAGTYTEGLPIDAGTYTVMASIAAQGNYTAASGELTLTIKKAAASGTASAVDGLTYNGQAQNLVTAGAVTGGTMQYSTDGSSYSADIPTGTGAGTYTVWYKVVGDANHSDTDPVQVEVTIKKADPDVTAPDGLTATYGDTLSDVALSGGWTWDTPDASVGNVGGNTFAATYMPSDTTNYNNVNEDLTVTVSAKDITGAEITLGDSLTYTGQEQTQQIASVTVDGLTVTYTVTGNTATDAGDYTLTISGTGNFIGTATKGWSIAKANYTGTTGVSSTVLANWPDKVTLPDIPAGASYGTPSTTDDLTGLSIEGGVLHYTGGESITEGQEYKITVPVNGGTNYNDYQITVTLTGSDKQTLTITGVTAQNGTYNGQTQAGYAGTPAAVGYTGDFTVTYNTEDGKAPTNAGTYSVTIAIPDTDPQYVGSIVLEFTIAKKALTVSAPSASVYVGDNAPLLALTYTGLVDGESVTPSEAPAFTITKSDDTEIALADAVQTAGTYTITWSNAGDTTFLDGANYAIQTETTGTLTVSARSSGGGGSSNITTEITKNPDGSTTTTVTNKNTGTVTETTKFPDGSKEVVETKKDGTVTTTTTDTAGNKTQVVENTDGSSKTTVDNKDGSGSVTLVDENGQVVSEATLSQSAVAAAQEKGEAVALPMPEVPVTTDRENAPTVTVDLPSGTSAKVEIPVENVTAGTVAVIVKADGTEEVIKTSLTTENGVAVTLSDGDTVKIVDNTKTFADVPGNYWGAEAVDFAVSRELFAGTSATTFAPDTAMTRAMIVTVLARFEGVDTTTGSTWYEAGQQWAMENGVSDGTNMDASLTREQLATMLYRYAQSKGYDTTQGGMAIREYADFEQISDYAVEAMTWAVNTGLISGTSTTTLSPQGLATRAQVATILMRFIEGMA